MLQLMSIPNPEQFLTLVDKSAGNVTLCLPNETRCDLKNDKTAREMIRVLKPRCEGICILLSDPRDILTFMRYMMEGAYR